MTDTEWLDVDTGSVSASDIEENEGINIRLNVSPYDLPEALRGLMDGDFFCLQFRYLNDKEPKEKIQLDDHITLTTGSVTGRILEIRINVIHLDVDKVRLEVCKQVMHALDEFRDNERFKTNKLHAKAAVGAVFQKYQDLLQVGE